MNNLIGGHATISEFYLAQAIEQYGDDQSIRNYFYCGLGGCHNCIYAIKNKDFKEVAMSVGPYNRNDMYKIGSARDIDIITMAKEGKTYANISEKFGIKTQRVQQILKLHGFTKNKKRNATNS